MNAGCRTQSQTRRILFILKMNYQETINYLYQSAPLFQNVGGKAYKEGLDNSLALDAHLGNPQCSFPSIHIAGTNGKGSCAHSIASVLQGFGLKVGLYTSPHLVDFRERIKIDGEMIPKDYVVRFVERERAFFEPLHPSFFELTTAMAFLYFADSGVDVAVVEVGLGGRLDCTNVITPVLSIITNISLDHTQFLGSTPAAIATEKAGIIKHGVPVVIGEADNQTRPVFEQKAIAEAAPIIFAEDKPEVTYSKNISSAEVDYESQSFGTIKSHLSGEYQARNMNTILTSLRQIFGKGLLPALNSKAYGMKKSDVESVVRKGLEDVPIRTGLMGRWQIVGNNPTVVCDTGHNPGGWKYLTHQLHNTPCRQLHIVFGMAADKDVASVLSMLPHSASYYFTQASVRRAMPCSDLQLLAKSCGLQGKAYPTVRLAYEAALTAAQPSDFIYVGGSSFVVADFLNIKRAD